MIHYLIHEIAVVRYHDEAPLETGEVLLQDIQGEDIQVVGRLVQHQEVGVGDQHGAEVKASFLAPAQLVHVIVLLLRREKEVLQELRGGQPVCGRD